MCKIDFLGSGVCESGIEKQFVSYYPQGRMDLYAALIENKIPVTEKCVDIAESCDLCGKCDYQCYFVTEMRPSKVMKALKEHVSAYLKNGGTVTITKDDEVLAGIKKIVGNNWATSDPAIAVTYSHDLCPLAVPKMPDYVIMPETKEEISSLIKLLNNFKVPYTIRGNGSDTMGFAMNEGAIIDLNRMKTIDFDEKNWLVKTGPGVSAFDLQREAQKRGYRVNAAEPAALVCANIMCSGIVSTFSATYGTVADNIVDAEFIAKDGSFFTLNDVTSPNLFSFKYTEADSPGVCVSASVKLHPVTDDESGILVPFENLEKAVSFIKECSVRHIGLALAILGSEYTSSFFAPTKKLADEIKTIFCEKLGIPYLVLLIGDKYAVRTVHDMGYPFFDQRLFKALLLGMSSLKSAEWMNLLQEMTKDEPFSYLHMKQFAELVETALIPSPESLAKEVEPDLQPFFEKLFSRPEMSDLVWLNTFRIISSRMGREKPFVVLMLYAPIDFPLIEEIINKLKNIAGKFNLKNEFGFITPLDNGKRCVFEYDYYFDNNNEEEIAGVQQAATEAAMLIGELSARTGTVKWIRYLLYQGFCRKENLLYT